MPIIHLGGDGWVLVRTWPETQLHEQWQHQLSSMLRGPVPCRQWVMHTELSPLRDVAVDWSHPGIGKVTTPVWQKTVGRARSSIIGTFEAGDFTVSFTSAGNGRRANATTTTAHISAQDQKERGRQFNLVLEEPIRVCVENAALLALMCEAVSIVAWDLAEAPAMLKTAEANSRTLKPPAVSPKLRTQLEGLDSFQSKVLELICSGWTNTEIATATRMSLSSVRAATSVIYERLEVRNRHEAAALCGAAFTRRPQLA